MKKTYWYLVVLASLTLASLACNLGASQVENTPTALPVLPEGPGDASGTGEETLEGIQSGAQVELEISEQELTSLVAEGIEAQDEAPIEEPQVQLRDGRIRFLATVQRQGFNLPAEVVMTVQPDAQGKPDFDVVSATIGPLPVPGNVTSELESGLNETFAAEIDSRAPNTRIESIVVSDGIMTITGRTQ
jgi:hypothetical protein